jgi:raffinose/stachyose/melibiose transport system permease protein
LPGVVLALSFHWLAPAFGTWYAFTDWNGLSAAHWVGLRNFRDIFSDQTTRDALWHTLELAGPFVVLVNLIGFALALGLNRAIKTRNILRSIFFIPAVVSPLATAYIWQYIFDSNGPLNQLLGGIGGQSWKQAWLGNPHLALWVILVVLIWHYMGLTMVIYLAGLQAIPQELDEAAAVDGARTWTRVRRITIPLLAPAITVNTAYMTIQGLRVFDQVIGLTGGGPVNATETLSTQVWKQTFAYGRFGYGAALALILAALVAAVVLMQMLILRAREARVA